MREINYEARNKRASFSNGEYDLQRLVGKKYLGMDYQVSAKRRYPDRDAYDVFLKWEGYIMSFFATDTYEIPKELDAYIGCRLEDWDTLPNHAHQMFILFFEKAKDVVSFNIYYYVN